MSESNRLLKIVYLGSGEGFEATKHEALDRAEVTHCEADKDALLRLMHETDGILDASMRIRITNEMVKHSPRLKVISCATTGSDHIERKEIDQRGIAVRTLREDPEFLKNLTPAAELSWTLLMACARRLTGAFEHTRQGKWVREDFPGVMLNGKRLGVIGCGRIGSWMARYARAFGMEAIGFDPYVDPLPTDIRPATLKEIFKTSDFVSIHVHLSDETRGMVTRDLLEMAKPGLIFINTSRGGLVDEQALLDCLKSGILSGAGLDVLDGEPDISSHPLIQYAKDHHNLIITPHCGGFSPDAVRLVCSHAAKKILSYF